MEQDEELARLCAEADRLSDEIARHLETLRRSVAHAREVQQRILEERRRWKDERPGAGAG